MKIGDFISRVIWLIISVVLFAGYGYGSDTKVKLPTVGPVQELPLIRPSSAFIENTIHNARSFIPNPFYTQVIDLVIEMDRMHSIAYPPIMVTSLDSGEAVKWIETETFKWPRLAPKGERLIWSLLKLQIDILYRILNFESPRLASELMARTKKRRVRSDEERFFHDFRDRFVCEVLDTLGAIALMQSALGGGDPIRFHFPLQVTTKDALLSYLVDKIRIVTDRAVCIRSAQLNKGRTSNLGSDP